MVDLFFSAISIVGNIAQFVAGLPWSQITGPAVATIIGFAATSWYRKGYRIRDSKYENDFKEKRKDRPEDFNEIAEKVNTEVWRRVGELPQEKQRLIREGEAISLQTSRDLAVVARQVEVLDALVEGWRKAGATTQTLQDMMRPGAVVEINPVTAGNNVKGDKRSHSMTTEEAEANKRDVEAIRKNLHLMDRHLKESYNILGVDLKIGLWDALQNNDLPDFRPWVEQILADYPKAIYDLIKNNGLAEAAYVLQQLRDHGTLLHIPKDERFEAHREAARHRINDRKARKRRDLPQASREERPATRM